MTALISTPGSVSATSAPGPTSFRWTPPAWLSFTPAAAVAVVLTALSGRYGYHRDELYFLAAGHHLAWGYPDQGPLVPALARLMSAVAPGSLPLLRLPTTLAAVALVLCTVGLVRELGAGLDRATARWAQLLAASCVAAAPVVLASGHLLGTTSVDLLFSTATVWFLVRACRLDDSRWLLPAGCAVGLGMLNKPLIGTLALVLMVALVVSRQRRLLLSRWALAGAAAAVVLSAPYLLWQARHGWPQLDLARAIANGSSGTSTPRAAFVPLQLGMWGPFAAPVWIVGLIALLRHERFARFRWLVGAYAGFAALLLVTDGKPYYLGGLYPVLLAAGAAPAVAWLRRGSSARRRTALAALAADAAFSLVVFLPLLPAAALHNGAIVAINYDAGETVGWPQYVAQIAAVAHANRTPQGQLPPVLTQNYGEAGAVDRYGSRDGLAPAASGHNGYWYWSLPALTANPSADPVVVVGHSRSYLQPLFASVQRAGTLHERHDIPNDENGTPIWVCRGLRGSWAQLWPQLQTLG